MATDLALGHIIGHYHPLVEPRIRVVTAISYQEYQKRMAEAGRAARLRQATKPRT